jgi:hypothetical protein
MDKQKKAYGLAILTVLSWSTVATAFKLSLRHLSHIELMLYSSAVATLLLAGVLIQRRAGNRARMSQIP